MPDKTGRFTLFPSGTKDESHVSASIQPNVTENRHGELLADTVKTFIKALVEIHLTNAKALFQSPREHKTHSALQNMHAEV